MMPSTHPIDLCRRYFPAPAADYCYALWQQHGFSFRIAKGRRTRLGDYKYATLKGHRISVNGTLNPYSFTFTYLHEVAHLLTFNQYGQKKRRVRPHGQEWKQHFRELMRPLLNGTPETTPVFPFPLQVALQRHMSNPAASSGADPVLLAAFRVYDVPTATDKIPLSELCQGEVFRLGSRLFVKEQTRRTRALCKDLKTHKKYTVAETAWVEKTTAS